MGTIGRRIAAAGLALTLALSACSGDDNGDDTPVITDPVETTDSTTSSTTTEATTTTEDPDAAVKAEVEAAYLAYWDAFLEIFAAPNPNNPLIDKHTTGAVRRKTIEAISADILEGRSVRPPPDPADYSQKVLNVVVNGTTASVVACVVDGAHVVLNATDEILDDDLVTLLISAELVLEETWKVSNSTVDQKREGRWDCED